MCSVSKLHLFHWQSSWQRGESETYGESNMEIYNTIWKIDSLMGICWLTQGTQTGALWQYRRVGWGGRWKGGSGGKGHACTYDWFLLIYDRKPQNSVKQISLN